MSVCGAATEIAGVVPGIFQKCCYGEGHEGGHCWMDHKHAPDSPQGMNDAGILIPRDEWAEGKIAIDQAIKDAERRLNERRYEKVDHPAHYGGDTVYEAIKVIEAWNLGFHLGSALKYICRAHAHGTLLTDLKKARWYLDRHIAQVEKEESK